MDTKAVSIGLILAGAALDGSAITLGSPQGAAWIGQPLELSFPITTEAGADNGPLCPSAEVFFADTPLDSGRLQIQQLPGNTPDTLRVRLTSTALVDEPVVRVTLRLGCQQKVSRSYVILADLPSTAVTAAVAPLVVPTVSEAPPAAVAMAPPTTSSQPAAAPTRAANIAVPGDAPAATATLAQTTPKARSSQRHAVRRTPLPASGQAKAPPARTTESGKTGTATSSRLKLDPLEVLVERVKTLESTTAAVPLEDLVKDAGRVQQLQNDVQALLRQAEKNEAALKAMRERLEKAESDRLTTLLSFGLAALALLSAIVIAVIWSRRRPPTWNQESATQRSPASTIEPGGGDTTLPAQELQVVAKTQPVAPVAPPAKKQPLDVDLVEMDEWDWPKTGRQTLNRR